MAENKKAKHLLLIDGSGYIFRAYHALPPMNRPDGTPVNAVYGFTSMLTKLVEDSDADYLAVIFDTARRTFRSEIYPDYKANRPPPPEDLIPQFALIRASVEAFGLPQAEMEGYEADDLIATYAKEAAANGHKVTIVSSDKDLMQLVDENISMQDPMKGTAISYEEVKKKFGVKPEKVIDVQALAGDSTDNVPGVPGVGVKTAAQLIDEFGDLDTLLSRANEIKQPKRRENLVEYAEQARISRDLVTLKQDVPVKQKYEDFVIREPEPEKLLGFLEEQGFKSTLAKVVARLGAAGQDVSVTDNVMQDAPAGDDGGYTLIQEEIPLKTWVKAAYEQGIVAVDTETNSLDSLNAELIGISLALPKPVEGARACYIPVGHIRRVSQATLDLGEENPLSQTRDAPKQLTIDKLLEILKPLLEDPGTLKVAHNAKYDSEVFANYNVRMGPLDDTMLLSYVLDGGSHGHGLDDLTRIHLGRTNIKYKEVTGSGKKQIGFAEVELDAALDYAAEDADVTLRLYQLLKPRLVSEHMATVYERIERPLISVLEAMERAGIRVDIKVLKSLSADFEKRIALLGEEIHRLAERSFNIGSPKQLGEVLFDEMGFPGGKKGKTGAYATGANILEGLAAQGHELPKKVLEWRQLSKLKSTYTDALIGQIDSRTGRVHTSFAQAIASTGRLSSNDPNLQNIPIRTEDGRKIRTAFVADDKNVLLSADYSQIELRLLAHVADIGTLKKAFKDGVDIHALTASEVFGIPISQLDSPTRNRAKAINFGIIYGISPFGLARQLDIAQGDAKSFIEAYFARYPGVKGYMDNAKEFAQKTGYVETIFGRRVHVPGIKDKNLARRNFMERAAINAPLQGSAADIIKRAMILMPDVLKSADLKAQMLLQVHDELIFEVPRSELEKTEKLVKNVMESAASLSVPLICDTGYGLSWDEAH
ncbi:MAG: DNA polymerase I [Rhodospirillaceae bacterium]|nr:DNA polymerase I [Rhodospirillaceae bacterium]